jgi:AcrR family transcriptional regulator
MSSGALRSVWLRPERPPRDRRLSRARIVAVAIESLDAECHEGLSMRGVAARLGVTAGSLYWYVAGKDELLELALDEVMGEVIGQVTDAARPGPDEADWRSAINGMARSQREMLRRHPWALALLGTLPNMGPNALRLAETGLGILARAGFAEDLLDAALAAVNDQVIGSVVAETAWRGAVQQSDSTIADWQEQAADYLREIGRRHPLLSRRLVTAEPPDIGEVSDARFTLALSCLLDGLAARREVSAGEEPVSRSRSAPQE